MTKDEFIIELLKSLDDKVDKVSETLNKSSSWQELHQKSDDQHYQDLKSLSEKFTLHKEKTSNFILKIAGVVILALVSGSVSPEIRGVLEKEIINVDR
jgi:hypothetical protein